MYQVKLKYSKMKKRKIALILIISMFLLTNVSISVTAYTKNFEKTPQDPLPRIEQKKWTWLFYNDLDYYPSNPLKYDRMDVFVEEAFSAENLDVILIDDTYEEPARI